MGIFKSKNKTIYLRSYKFEELDSDSLFEIEGKKTGFSAWLFEKIKLTNRDIKFIYNHDTITLILGRKYYEIITSRDIYNYEIGYKSKKILLLTSIILFIFSIIMLLYAAYDYEIGLGLILFLIFSTPSVFLFWRYKRSNTIKIIFSTQNKLSVGINLKNGLKGEQISESDLTKIRESINQSLNKSSRWFRKLS